MSDDSHFSVGQHIVYGTFWFLVFVILWFLIFILPLRGCNHLDYHWDFAPVQIAVADALRDATEPMSEDIAGQATDLNRRLAVQQRKAQIPVLGWTIANCWRNAEPIIISTTSSKAEAGNDS